MKKSLLFSALFGLFLSACGGQSNQAPQNSDAASAASVPTPAASETAAADDTAGGTLNIYNWSNYVDESTVKDFAEQNRIKVNYDYYENNETLEGKVLSGSTGYDLVVPGIAFLPRQIQAGAYQPVNKDLIPNYANIDPELLKMMETADPGNKYAVPYFSGVNTLAIYRQSPRNPRRPAARKRMGPAVQTRIHQQAQTMRHLPVGHPQRNVPHCAELSG